MFTSIRFMSFLVACSLCGVLYAADKPEPSVRKVSFAPADAVASGQAESKLTALPTSGPIFFSAPPRELSEEAYQLYQPLATYLSRVLGRPVTYVYPRSWLTYQKEMTQGSYDIVFDGAHFNSWRISHLQHNALVKIPEQQTFAVVTRKDNTQVTSLKQLAGKKICAMGPSNLGTLTVLSEFEPTRQPLILEHVSWAKVYNSVIEGRCAAATLPLAMLQKMDGGGNFTRSIYQSRQLPNQAFSAGPRLTAEEQNKLANALVSADARKILEPILTANGAKELALASKDEFNGMDAYLKDVWGYAR